MSELSSAIFKSFDIAKENVEDIPSLLLLLVASFVTAENNDHISSHVDPFLGIEGGGNTIPSPSMPFGMDT